MIPAAYIREWRNLVPWQETDMIEQDLVICRAIVEIFNDSYLAENMAFRGGTAIHKLFMNPQPRYSEDIDLVQKKLALSRILLSNYVRACHFWENRP